MNMIICGEPCEHQHDGCCGLQGAGIITNAALSPCRYFSPKDKLSARAENRTYKGKTNADKNN